jgi:oxygen-independent coproporphyrinogen III oxidase
LRQIKARGASVWHIGPMQDTITDSAPPLTPELLARIDTPGPRYTSYPTADRFSEAFGQAEYLAALQRRRHDAVKQPMSIYVHLPFCASPCYFCACNKIITRHHEVVDPYLDSLRTEMRLNAQALGARQTVSQLHLGGGTPTFLSDAQLSRLMTDLHEHFDLLGDAELSIEVDPRTVDARRLAHLAALGFNRLSFGVQDVQPRVQQAVHRVQPVAQTEALVVAARRAGFVSINVDLIYGLPLQTTESLSQTVRTVCDWRPDRVALYAYAHLPERFKPQRRIHEADLPPAGERLSMLGAAMAGFVSHGYRYIGMDHFALPDDALAVAQQEGRLHRNFQGYSTQPDCDLIGLGVSAIGRVGNTYSQNAKTLAEYHTLVQQGRFPVQRGIALTPDDVLRRELIMALMCQGRVDVIATGQAHAVNFRDHFAAEWAALEAMAEAGLVTLSDTAIEVTPQGRFFVRALAMVFDRHLQAQPRRERFSRLV